MSEIFTQIINLDRDQDRLDSATKSLTGLGLTPVRLRASEKETLPTDRLADARATLGRDLLIGEVGCFDSHRRAAAEFLKTDALLGLVCEDDVQARPDADRVLGELQTAAKRATLWDVVNLARPVKHARTPVRAAIWSVDPQLFHAHYMPVTTTALLWSRGGARMFLTVTERMLYPVDIAIQTWCAQTDRGLGFEHPPFFARDLGSTIEGSAKRSLHNRKPGYQRLRLTRLLQTHVAAHRNKRQRRAG